MIKELDILNRISNGYIARNMSGELLWFPSMPINVGGNWFGVESSGLSLDDMCNACKVRFQFIGRNQIFPVKYLAGKMKHIVAA